MNIMPELLGLVMVGGKSSRMGKPKAYMDYGQGPQWQACERVLRSLCSKVYFSVSDNLEPKLPHHFLLEDIFSPPIGPLGGVLSAFHYGSDKAYFVLACDLCNFSEDAAAFLKKSRNPHKQASVFMKDGLLEPLCAIYEPAIFLDLARAWAEKKRCLRKILADLDVEKVICPNLSWLHNVNYPHEIMALPHQVDTKNVTVLYYAALREHMKCSQETITTKAVSMGELYDELTVRYGFMIDRGLMRFAQNDELVYAQQKINDGDEIVLIPPVSGG